MQADVETYERAIKSLSDQNHRLILENRDLRRQLRDLKQLKLTDLHDSGKAREALYGSD